MKPSLFLFLDLDECFSNLYDCQGITKCVNEPGSYRCICADGYTGDGKSCTGNAFFGSTPKRQLLAVIVLLMLS